MPNIENKMFSSRLTRWVDRLLTFAFGVVQVAGRTLGMADYLPRILFTVKNEIGLNDVLEKNEATSKQSKSVKNVPESYTVNRIKVAKLKQPITTRQERNSLKAKSETAGNRELNRSPSI